MLVFFRCLIVCLTKAILKVEQLDDIVTAKAGFKHKFCISGQTYSRQQVSTTLRALWLRKFDWIISVFQDVQLIFSLACIGAAVKKICTDIRVLQAMGELLEPFEKVGTFAARHSPIVLEVNASCRTKSVPQRCPTKGTR